MINKFVTFFRWQRYNEIGLGNDLIIAEADTFLISAKKGLKSKV